MSWAKHAIASLAEGRPCKVRPHGNSMTPKIYSGDSVYLEPTKVADLVIGDIVLCKVRGNIFIHLVKAVDLEQERVLIGNNHGHTNGWTSTVYGKVVHVEK